MITKQALCLAEQIDSLCCSWMRPKAVSHGTRFFSKWSAGMDKQKTQNAYFKGVRCVIGINRLQQMMACFPTEPVA